MQAAGRQRARDQARALFAQACVAADPGRALAAVMARQPPDPPGPGGIWRLIAFGKAAVAMAGAALPRLGGAPVQALAVTHDDSARPPPGCTLRVAGHPLPDARGLAAAQEVAQALRAAGPADRVVVLVSGGGSALLPAPVAGLTLADKQAVNRLLLAAGLEISAINTVRAALSQLKGGGMLRLAAPAPVTAYILSDVIGDDLRVIASGPTVAAPGSRADAAALLRGHGLWLALPLAVQAVLAAPEPPLPPLPAAQNILIGSNGQSLRAVQAAAGAGARIVTGRLTGDVAAAADLVVQAVAAAGPGPAVLVFGGETTVTLRGQGRGGRNQELALRVALALEARPGPWAFLSGGTDGRDGPTDAAGGLVDAGSAARIRAAGASPEGLLADNDSHAALALAGDLLITGATGTNVADVQIFVQGAAAPA